MLPPTPPPASLAAPSSPAPPAVPPPATLQAGLPAVDSLSALPPWATVLLYLAGSLLLAKLLADGGGVVVRRLTRRIDGNVDDVVLRGIHAPLYVTVVLLGGYLSVDALDLAALDLPLRAGLLSAVTVLWAATLVRLGRRVAEEATTSDRFDGVAPIFQNLWTAAVVAVSGFLLLSFWRVDVTPLLASAGVVGIVVGFAARDTIANFFGSISLYFDGTYEVGDFVVLESGERGRVEDVSIRSTVLRTRDDVLITVPNSVLNAARITNESAPRRRRRIRIPLGVAYGTDVDRLEELLLSVAAETDVVLDRPTPRVRLREFGEFALQVELLCWIGDPVLRGRATHELNRAIYTALTDAGVEIPFPQRDVRVSMADGDAGAAATPQNPRSPDGRDPALGGDPTGEAD